MQGARLVGESFSHFSVVMITVQACAFSLLLLSAFAVIVLPSVA